VVPSIQPRERAPDYPSGGSFSQGKIRRGANALRAYMVILVCGAVLSLGGCCYYLLASRNATFRGWFPWVSGESDRSS
jgi:hypothetical protein